MTTETVDIYHRTQTGTDPYGEAIYGYPPEPNATVTALGIAPRSSQEPAAVGRGAVITGLTVYLPLDTDIGPYDQVAVRGETYQVTGDVGRWISPYVATPAGLEVALDRTEG